MGEESDGLFRHAQYYENNLSAGNSLDQHPISIYIREKWLENQERGSSNSHFQTGRSVIEP